MKKIETLLEKYQWFLFSLGIGWTIINLIFFSSTNSLALLVIIIYWLTLGVIYRISEKFFFVLAIVCLILTVPPFLLKKLMWAERFSVWEFLFLCLGLWQFFYLELKEKFSRKK